jgi:short-subunit dehydrogenase
VDVVKLELNNSKDIQRVREYVLKKYGKLDVLINNADYCLIGPVEATSMKQIKKQFNTNFFGLVEMTKAFLTPMREERKGTIINISSITSTVGTALISIYGASKWAVSGFSEALHMEMMPYNVQVKTILPGFFATDMFKKMDEASESDKYKYYAHIIKSYKKIMKNVRGGSPDELAKLVYHAATDKDKNKTIYYAGKDAIGVPIEKRILGDEGYEQLITKLLFEKKAKTIKFLTQVTEPRNKKIKFIFRKL